MSTENEVVIEEQKDLVATRVPPGDRWKALLNKGIIFESLTEVLEFIYQEQGDTKFFLDARAGEVHSVKVEEKEVKPEPPKKWNLYGEY